MARNTLLPILLLAVAFSQVFGGVACCCYTRAIGGYVGAFHRAFKSATTLPSIEEQDSAAKSTAYRCPKCAARSNKSTDDKTEISSKDARSLKHRAKESARIDAPCSCSKFLCVSSEQNELPSISTKIGGAQWIAVEISRQSTANRPLAIQCGLPPLLVFGKHSWQSLACVWKN